MNQTPSSPSWRTVGSGLPDPFVTVLAYGALDRPGFGSEVMPAFLDPYHNEWLTADWKPLRDVTHWMPFPDPPPADAALDELREGVMDVIAGAIEKAGPAPRNS